MLTCGNISFRGAGGAGSGNKDSWGCIVTIDNCDAFRGILCPSDGNILTSGNCLNTTGGFDDGSRDGNGNGYGTVKVLCTLYPSGDDNIPVGSGNGPNSTTGGNDCCGVRSGNGNNWNGAITIDSFNVLLSTLCPGGDNIADNGDGSNITSDGSSCGGTVTCGNNCG